MENEEFRLIKVEHTLTDHGKRLKNVEGKIALLHQDLTGLKTVLINIKWWLVGVGSFYIAQQVGIMPLLKKLIGV